MIVHGFPSRLVPNFSHVIYLNLMLSSKAALQFEWAWQNPHKSRHFREADGRIFGNRRAKRVDKLIK